MGNNIRIPSNLLPAALCQADSKAELMVEHTGSVRCLHHEVNEVALDIVCCPIFAKKGKVFMEISIGVSLLIDVERASE